MSVHTVEASGKQNPRQQTIVPIDGGRPASSFGALPDIGGSE
jgi:hypothetical protein